MNKANSGCSQGDPMCNNVYIMSTELLCVKLPEIMEEGRRRRGRPRLRWEDSVN